MALGLLGGRLLLACVFAAAAMGKLRDRIGFRNTLVAFGVPAAAAPLAAGVIPSAELAVAILLLPLASAQGSSLALLALLVVFTAAPAVNLARGRTPACACFGVAASGPIGPVTPLANGALSGVACLISSAVPG